MAFLLRASAILGIGFLLASHMIGVSTLSYTALSMRKIYQVLSQQPLSNNPTEASKFYVGFSLQSSYGGVAIIFNNGTIQAFKLDGDQEYLEVMSRLSLDSSRHIAPPYSDPADSPRDYVRRGIRGFRKSLGLPASHDVGILANLLKQLQNRAEHALNIRIGSATVAVSHIAALYQDDITDSCEYNHLEYVAPKRYYNPVFWENCAANVGYGLGLCKHPEDSEDCEKEMKQMPSETILAIHYSQNALMTSLPIVRAGIYLYEPDYGHQEDFTLGFKNIGNIGENQYWGTVRSHIERCMRGPPGMNFKTPVRVVLQGDMVAEKRFVEVLREALVNVMGGEGANLPVIATDPELVVAKGAAELMRRSYF